MSERWKGKRFCVNNKEGKRVKFGGLMVDDDARFNVGCGALSPVALESEATRVSGYIFPQRPTF